MVEILSSMMTNTLFCSLIEHFNKDCIYDKYLQRHCLLQTKDYDFYSVDWYHNNKNNVSIYYAIMLLTSKHKYICKYILLSPDPNRSLCCCGSLRHNENGANILAMIAFTSKTFTRNNTLEPYYNIKCCIKASYWLVLRGNGNIFHGDSPIFMKIGKFVQFDVKRKFNFYNSSLENM